MSEFIKIKIKVNRKDLYRYCADLGLMLSWGIPLMDILTKKEYRPDNSGLKNINDILAKTISRGYSLSHGLQWIPRIFRPAFTKWVNLGERFGLLDEVFMQVAGILKFDQLIMGKNIKVKPEVLGDFILKLSGFLKDIDTSSLLITSDKLYIIDNKESPPTKNDILPLIKKLTDDPVICEWIDIIPGNFYKKRFFARSMSNYMNRPVFRKIANPLFWHLLDSAEEGGYIHEMIEILSLYLKDKYNILPQIDKIGDNIEDNIETEVETDVDILCEEGTSELAGKILEKTLNSRGKKCTIIIKNNRYMVVMEDDQTELHKFIEVKTEDHVLLRSVTNYLKSIIGMDIAEMKLRQYVKTDIKINNNDYILKAEFSPPHPMLPDDNWDKVKAELRDEPEIIDIEIENAQ
ncbi:MAG: hypothetical protein K8T10_05170 [Candidatus Eremiobacteraeota bacterium]|nr:hypothetical protein [Candidatus Eremiobacteraeota bacterium]